MPRFNSLVALLAVGGLLLAGCSSTDANANDPVSPSASPTATESASPTPKTPAPRAKVSIRKLGGGELLQPGDSLAIDVTGGTIRSVSVVDSKGKDLSGSLAGGVWTPNPRFLPNESYTATAVVTNPDGKEAKATAKYRTPQGIRAGYDILYHDQTVGVGMPVILQFVSSIKAKDLRAAIERNIEITTVPETEGAWGWIDNRRLMWRPKEFWKPGTKVSVKANLAGLKTGPNKWATYNYTSDFTIGPSHIAKVDIPGHTMTFTENGKVVRTYPVTNGKRGFTTRSGTKVIIEKRRRMVMDSRSISIANDSPEGYRLDVQYAMRTTWTGEFVHAAPWSVGAHGKWNASHGCTGLSIPRAAWAFNFSRVGDVIIYSGSGREMTPGEGIGVWQLSWKEWQKRSALA
ncbi:MAG: hypothetical protein CR980_01070 [Propionibacteriales bacterium]|nr:MAG: hypothetical protein CR980_01070 [Propionibacteriales bacterium]